MALHFTKMSALGNDFIVIDGFHYNPSDFIPSVALFCNRRFGIGADGVIFVLPSEHADFQMRIFNSDGSEAEMCGNGLRCFAHYLYHHNTCTTPSMTVETLAGTMIVTKQEELYRVDMGRPHFDADDIPFNGTARQHNAIETSIGGFSVLAVSMGNPHAIIHTDAITDEQVCTAGPQIEIDSLFPAKTNVEFVKVLSDDEVEMRVWERGCGETLACGTGACAVVVAGITQKLHKTDVTVHLRGGDLQISWSGNESDSVFMTGPASLLFTGETTLK